MFIGLHEFTWYLEKWMYPFESGDQKHHTTTNSFFYPNLYEAQSIGSRFMIIDSTEEQRKQTGNHKTLWHGFGYNKLGRHLSTIQNSSSLIIYTVFRLTDIKGDHEEGAFPHVTEVGVSRKNWNVHSEKWIWSTKYSFPYCIQERNQKIERSWQTDHKCTPKIGWPFCK